MEKVKKAFSPPASLPVGVVTEQSILVGSVVDYVNMGGVNAAQQEVIEQNAADDTFNHTWE